MRKSSLLAAMVGLGIVLAPVASAEPDPIANYLSALESGGIHNTTNSQRMSATVVGLSACVDMLNGFPPEDAVETWSKSLGPEVARVYVQTAQENLCPKTLKKGRLA